MKTTMTQLALTSKTLLKASALSLFLTPMALFADSSDPTQTMSRGEYLSHAGVFRI